MGGKFVGGCDETLQVHMKKELSQLLREVPALGGGAPGAPPGWASGVWDALAPAAALATAHPCREVSVLPLPAERPPFTVVVAGGTGAGKSTLLNALLGFELLPTS